MQKANMRSTIPAGENFILKKYMWVCPDCWGTAGKATDKQFCYNQFLTLNTADSKITTLLRGKGVLEEMDCFSSSGQVSLLLNLILPEVPRLAGGEPQHEQMIGGSLFPGVGNLVLHVSGRAPWLNDKEHGNRHRRHYSIKTDLLSNSMDRHDTTFFTHGVFLNPWHLPTWGTD